MLNQFPFHLTKLFPRKYTLIQSFLILFVFLAIDIPHAMAGKILEERSQYSQHHEEAIIRDFFNDKENGFFVDIGAYDYKKFSNTYYLEKNLGWSGIAVDALAEFAEGYELHRPKTKFFVFLVGNKDDLVLPFYRSEIAPASSVYEQYMEYAKPMLNKRPDEELKYDKIAVPTITMNTLLDQNKVKEIDLLTMDIELSEPAALAGFDIQRFKPKLVCIEAHLQIRKILFDYFKDNEYVIIKKYLEHDRLNWYFRPAS